MTEPRVRVVVGTSACLDPEQARAIGVTLVPLHLHVNEVDYRDTFDITLSDLFRLLGRGILPQTSSTTVGEYLAAFDSERTPALCLTEGAGLSAMDQAARVAAGLAEAEVDVVDTATAAGGLRLVTLAAVRLASQGLSLGELSERVRGLCLRVEVGGMLETVEFLTRSGRIPEVARWGSAVLRVRPVIRFRRGRGSLATLVRSRVRGLEHLHRMACDLAKKEGAGARGRGLKLAVFHADALGLAQRLTEDLRKELSEAELSLCEMTPAMAVHTGPGTVGYGGLVTGPESPDPTVSP